MGPEDALSEGLRLSKKDRALLIRVLWVLLVTTYVAWTMGMLAILGVVAPFAKAADVDQLKQQVSISTRLQLVAEIRIQKRVYCANTDDGIRQSTLRYLYALVDDLKKVDANSQETPVPVCVTP